MLDQTESRQWSPTTKGMLQKRLQALPEHFTRLLKDIIGILTTDANKLTDAGFWLNRRQESINAMAEQGAPELLLDGGVYLGVGIRANRLYMLYTGRGNFFLHRVVGQHLPAIAAGIMTSIHYRLAAECDEVLYFPIITLPDSDRKHLLSVAEWFVCSLLGTYQLDQTENQTRSAFKLPTTGVRGANATRCVEKPNNSTGHEPTPEPVESQDPGFLRDRWRFQMLSRQHRLHLALRASGAAVGDSPFMRPLEQVREAVMGHYRSLFTSGLLRITVLEKKNEPWAHVFGYSVPRSLLHELGVVHGDTLTAHLLVEDRICPWQDVCSLGPREGALYGGIKVCLKSPQSTFGEYLQIPQWPPTAASEGLLEFVWSCLDGEEAQARVEAFDEVLQEESKRRSLLVGELSPFAEAGFMGEARLSPGRMSVALPGEASFQAGYNLVSSSASDFTAAQGDLLDLLGYDEHLLGAIWPNVPVMFDLEPQNGSFAASPRGIKKLPPGGTALVLRVFSPQTQSWERLPMTTSCASKVDPILDAFAEIVVATAPDPFADFDSIVKAWEQEAHTAQSSTAERPNFLLPRRQILRKGGNKFALGALRTGRVNLTMPQKHIDGLFPSEVPDGKKGREVEVECGV